MNNFGNSNRNRRNGGGRSRGRRRTGNNNSNGPFRFAGSAKFPHHACFEHYDKSLLNTKTAIPSEMHCVTYKIDDSNDIYVAGGALGVLKFYNKGKQCGQVDLRTKFQGAVVTAMTSDKFPNLPGVLFVAFEATVNNEAFAKRRIARGATVGHIICLTYQSKLVCAIHRKIKAERSQQEDVPFAHFKKISTLQTVTTQNGSLLVSASESLRCTVWRCNSKLQFQNICDFYPHFSPITKILQYPKHPSKWFFTTCSLDGTFKVHTLVAGGGSSLQVQTTFHSHDAKRVNSRGQPICGQPIPIVDMTASIDGGNQFLLLACVDKPHPAGSTPMNKLKLFRLNTTAGSIDPYAAYPMFPYQAGGRQRVTTPTSISFRGKLKVVNNKPDGEVIMGTEDGKVMLLGKDWLSSPDKPRKPRATISFNRNLSDGTRKFETWNMGITGIGVGSSGQILMVSKYGRVGYLIENQQ